LLTNKFAFVEESSVLVSLKGVTDFSPGLPVHGTLFDRQVKSIHGERTEMFFWRREDTPLLQEVQKPNKKAVVSFPFRGGRGATSPSLTLGATKAETSNHPSCGVAPEGGTPSSADGGPKTVMHAPGGFVTKKNHREG
jgi:hypothetical protein